MSEIIRTSRCLHTTLRLRYVAIVYMPDTSGNSGSEYFGSSASRANINNYTLACVV